MIDTKAAASAPESFLDAAIARLDDEESPGRDAAPVMIDTSRVSHVAACPVCGDAVELTPTAGVILPSLVLCPQHDAQRQEEVKMSQAFGVDPMNDRPVILIVGSRDAPNFVLMKLLERVTEIKKQRPHAIIRTGAGWEGNRPTGGRVDHAALRAAAKVGLMSETWPALWQRHGNRSAGPRRNAEMVTGPWSLWRVESPRNYTKPFVAHFRVRIAEDEIMGGSWIAPILRKTAERAGWRLSELVKRASKDGGWQVSEVYRSPKPDLCIAFWDGLSTGTVSTMNLCGKHGVPLERWIYDGPTSRWVNDSENAEPAFDVEEFDLLPGA